MGHAMNPLRSCLLSMNFVLLALPAIKSSFRGDYATPRSHCFSLRSLDASVHFGIRSLAQHKLSSADFSVHRGSPCSYRRSGVDFSAHAGFARSFSVCSSTSLGRHRIDVPSRSSALAGSDSVVQRVPIHFTRTASNAVPANLSLTLTTPAVYSVSHGRTKPTAADRPTFVHIFR